MRPGFRCDNCTNLMERVDEQSWMCVPCRINEYWFEEDETKISDLLQREWDAESRGEGAA